MPTLYVEKIPEELYKALPERARQNRKSITAEVLTLAQDFNLPIRWWTGKAISARWMATRWRRKT